MLFSIARLSYLITPALRALHFPSVHRVVGNRIEMTGGEEGPGENE